MSLYFDKNAQTPQKDTVNSWRVKMPFYTPGLIEHKNIYNNIYIVLL